MGDEVRSQCGPSSACGFGLKSHRLTGFVSCLSVLVLLTGCSFGDSNSGSGRASAPPAQQKSAAPKVPTAMDAFRVLAPAEGLKFTPLFNDRIDDNEDRFRRLEEAVQALRNDLDTVVPSMVRLVSVEKDIKELVGQLQTLTMQDGAVDVEPIPVPDVSVEPIKQTKQIPIPGEDVVGGIDKATANVAAADSAAPSSLVTPGAALAGLPPESAAPTSLPAAAEVAKTPSPSVAVPAQPPAVPPVAAKASPVASAPAAAPVIAATPPELAAGPMLGDVKSVRIGDHLDKTRIVLDLTAKPDFKTRLENNGKSLIVTLPQMKWATAPQWEASSAALVAAYGFAEGVLSMDMLYGSEIVSQQILSPASSGGNYRLVIDLFSPDVHER